MYMSQLVFMSYVRVHYVCVHFVMYIVFSSIVVSYIDMSVCNIEIVHGRYMSPIRQIYTTIFFCGLEELTS